MTTILFFDGRHAQIANTIEDPETGQRALWTLRVTTAATPGQYVRIDLGGGRTEQLCVGDRNRGQTIEWASDPAKMAGHLARDLGGANIAETDDAFAAHIAQALGCSSADARRQLHALRIAEGMA